MNRDAKLLKNPGATLKEHGQYPETVAVMLWGLDAYQNSR